MVTTKRVSVATVLGLILGFLFWLLGRQVATLAIPWQGAVVKILGFTVVGFAIGISGLQLRWWLHGLLLGLVFLLPLAFGSLWVGMKWFPEFVCVLVCGLVGGFLIELVTSVVFKARAGLPSA
jgi:hypothetical protein